MEIPFFSMFSAISECFVTAVVIYAVVANTFGKPLMWKPLGFVLAFEGCVNVIYMAGRASEADKSTELTTAMKIFYAGHGTLSLAMYLAIVTLYILAVIDVKNDREAWFRRHPTGSWVTVFFWMVSFISGEVIFFMNYGNQLFG
jgi:uncharacterized membrane protein YozB (DUF420 family)